MAACDKNLLLLFITMTMVILNSECSFEDTCSKGKLSCVIVIIVIWWMWIISKHIDIEIYQLYLSKCLSSHLTSSIRMVIVVYPYLTYPLRALWHIRSQHSCSIYFCLWPLFLLRSNCSILFFSSLFLQSFTMLFLNVLSFVFLLASTIMLFPILNKCPIHAHLLLVITSLIFSTNNG